MCVHVRARMQMHEYGCGVCAQKPYEKKDKNWTEAKQVAKEQTGEEALQLHGPQRG